MFFVVVVPVVVVVLGLVVVVVVWVVVVDGLSSLLLLLLLFWGMGLFLVGYTCETESDILLREMVHQVEYVSLTRSGS